MRKNSHNTISTVLGFQNSYFGNIAKFNRVRREFHVGVLWKHEGYTYGCTQTTQFH